MFGLAGFAIVLLLTTLGILYYLLKRSLWEKYEDLSPQFNSVSPEDSKRIGAYVCLLTFSRSDLTADRLIRDCWLEHVYKTRVDRLGRKSYLLYSSTMIVMRFNKSNDFDPARSAITRTAGFRSGPSGFIMQHNQDFFRVWDPEFQGDLFCFEMDGSDYCFLKDNSGQA